MNRRTVIALAGIAAVLVVLLLVLESFDGGRDDENRRLLPDFAGIANDLETVRITGADDPAGTTLRKEGDGWVVAERDGYPADTAKLRQLVIALAEAGIVEEKTANPEYYGRLGLGDPGEVRESGEGSADNAAGEDGEDGTGVQVVAQAGGSEATVIFGDTAQGDNRYARTPASPQTFLVDRNPAIPVFPGEWVAAELADVLAADVRRVSIGHADGESIELEKADPAAANFEIANVPEGRALSYPSVGDGIAGALAALELEDVRRATDAAATTTTVYETFDGLLVTVEAIEVPLAGADAAPDAPDAPAAPEAPDAGDEEVTDEDAAEADAEPETETWLRFTASVAEGTTATDTDTTPVAETAEADDAAPAATDTTPVAASDAAATDTAEAVTTDAGEAGEEAAAATESPQERADAMNARWSGWEYRIPDYKQELITRGWDDLLEQE